MPQATYTTEEIARLGQAHYDQQIREKVEAENQGKFIVIDVDTGDYEVDTDDVTAVKRARARHPGGLFYILRIGYPAAHRLGGRFTPAERR